MTQRCKYDEQVLDYVYGELGAAERAEFERHLSTCSSCPPQVRSFSRVHSEVRGLPRLEPSAEAMQRMTAVLMQEAAKVKPVTGKNGVPTHADPTAVPEGGKVLEFKPRGLRRILFHPATGVTAVAAAALLFVMFRPAGPGVDAPAGPPEAPHPTIAAAPATPGQGSPAVEAKKAESTVLAQVEGAAEPTSPAPAAAPQPEVTTRGGQEDRAVPEKTGLIAAGPKPALVPAAPSLDGRRIAGDLNTGTNKTAVLRGEARLTKSAKTSDSLDGLMMAEAERKPVERAREFAQPPPERPAAAGKKASGSPFEPSAKPEPRPLVALADKASSVDRDQAAPAEPRYPAPAASAPPPPPAAPAPVRVAQRSDTNSIGSELAARSRQRSVDELENQALAQAPQPSSVAGGTGGIAFDLQRRGYSASSTGSVANAPSVGKEEARGSTRTAAIPADDDDAPAAKDKGNSRREPAPNTSQSQGQNLAQNLAQNQDDAGQQQLQSARELMSKGRCTEALALLTRLEQSGQGYSTLRGLGEARAFYQLRCAPYQQGSQAQPQVTPTPYQQGPSQLGTSNVPPAPQAAAPPVVAPPRNVTESAAPAPAKPVYRQSNVANEMRKKASKAPPAKAKAADVAY